MYEMIVSAGLCIVGVAIPILLGIVIFAKKGK